MNPDPVAALRDVLAQNAKIPHLEAEIAHLRKHSASAELDAVLDALNEHPSSPEIGDHSMADQVRLIIKWWEETDVENNDAHNALDELGAPDEGTPAERIRALAAAKDRHIADLEGKIKAGRPEPGLAEVRFLPTPADLAADLDDADWGWLWITRVDAMRLFRALTKARGSKIDKTPTITSDTVHCAAIRLAALVEMAEEKDRRIAELEEELRTINAALDRYHANVGIEPGTMQIGQVLDYAATHYLEREHLTSEVRALAAERNEGAEPDRPDYLKPYSASLACPKCGCAVWWQFPDWRGPSEEGDAWCYRSRHMHRDTMKPMLGDGACDWTGRVRRCGSMRGLGARIMQ